MSHDVPAIIVDPLMLFREGLRRILYEADFQPVWCDDGPPDGPLPSLSDKAAPLLIIGTELKKAINHIDHVRNFYPLCRVALLLESTSKFDIITAIHGGADTLALKSASCETLIFTLRLVVDGASVLPTDLMDALLDVRRGEAAAREEESGVVYPTSASSFQPAAFGLSARELGVLRQLLVGEPNKQIARRLGITEATVKTHVKAILRKARVRNRTQVAIWASRLGLGTTPIQDAPEKRQALANMYVEPRFAS